MLDVLDGLVDYLESSVYLMTKETTGGVEYTEDVRSNEKLQKEVTVYNFIIKLSDKQLEFLTREEGSALSALSHVVSVILQHHDIAGTLGFSKLTEHVKKK